MVQTNWEVKWCLVGGQHHGKTLATDEAIDENAEFETVESPNVPRIIGVATYVQKRALRTIELPTIPDGDFVKALSEIPPV